MQSFERARARSTDVFDKEVELWMAPTAINKAAAIKGVVSDNPDLVVIKSTVHPHQVASNSNDPICFEYTNTGACGRLTRGEQCRCVAMRTHARTRAGSASARAHTRTLASGVGAR